jgi:predicted Rossmann fold nucleotide-binding protein DprA/Smf involved in DNA uptake
MARLTFITIEGSDELMGTAMQQAAQLLQPRVEREPAPLPAPVVEHIRQLAPPRQTRATPNNHKPATTATPPTDSTTGQTLRSILTKGPHTSAHLIRASGLTAPSVYTWLSAARKQGIVETREDPADGYKKNFLCR